MTGVQTCALPISQIRRRGVLLKIEKDATATYLRLAEQYGLTLASRMRLGLMTLVGESMLGALNRDLNEG